MTGPASAPVLALDGPGGSGKGTVGQIIAQRLGWHYLDSGALYRALALAAAARGLDGADAAALERLAAGLDVEFVPQFPDSVRVLVDGSECGEALRSEECGRRASRLAAIPEVRRGLLRAQRAARRPPGLVADGRDMGGVVFPDAGLKIFLTASAEVRAERRYKQLKDKGLDVSLRQLRQAIRDRDDRDASRASSPLLPADDACVVDSSGLGVEAVVASILEMLGERLAAQAPNTDSLPKTRRRSSC